MTRPTTQRAAVTARRRFGLFLAVMCGLLWFGLSEGAGSTRRQPRNAAGAPSPTGPRPGRTGLGQVEPEAGSLVPTGREEMVALRFALQTYDGTGEELEKCRDAVVQRLHDDPNFMGEAIRFLLAEPDPQLVIDLGFVIGRSSGSGRHAIGEAARRLFEGGAEAERRIAALKLLAWFPPDPRLVGAVSSVVERDADVRLRVRAVDTLGAWLRQSGGEEPADIGARDEIAMEVIEAINGSGERVIEESGLRALALQDAPLPLAVYAAMPRVFTDAIAPQERMLAATVLGRAAEDGKNFATQWLERAYGAEMDQEVKRVLATSLVCLGSFEALDRITGRSDEDRRLIEQLLSELRSAPERASR